MRLAVAHPQPVVAPPAGTHQDARPTHTQLEMDEHPPGTRHPAPPIPTLWTAEGPPRGMRPHAHQIRTHLVTEGVLLLGMPVLGRLIRTHLVGRVVGVPQVANGVEDPGEGAVTTPPRGNPLRRRALLQRLVFPLAKLTRVRCLR